MSSSSDLSSQCAWVEEVPRTWDSTLETRAEFLRSRTFWFNTRKAPSKLEQIQHPRSRVCCSPGPTESHYYMLRTRLPLQGLTPQLGEHELCPACEESWRVLSLLASAGSFLLCMLRSALRTCRPPWRSFSCACPSPPMSCPANSSRLGLPDLQSQTPQLNETIKPVGILPRCSTAESCLQAVSRVIRGIIPSVCLCRDHNPAMPAVHWLKTVF